MTGIGKRHGSVLVAVAVAVAAGLTATLLLRRSGDASGASTRAVVKVMRNATLGKRILVTVNGRTLYSLSAERHGRFICATTACVSLWKPLTVPAGVKPSGVDGWRRSSARTASDRSRTAAHRSTGSPRRDDRRRRGQRVPRRRRLAPRDGERQGDARADSELVQLLSRRYRSGHWFHLSAVFLP